MEKSLLFGILTICIAFAFGIFYYQKKANRFNLIEEILFSPNLERVMVLIQKNWQAEFIHSFKKIIKDQMINRIRSDLKLSINNFEKDPSNFLELLERLATHAQGNNPMASTIKGTMQSFFQDEKSIFQLYNKISNEYWTRPLGEKLVFISGFIPNNGSCLIIEIIGIYRFEDQVLGLIGFDIPFLDKIDTLNSLELAALKKLIRFYEGYDSGISRTERVTKYLAELGEKSPTLTQ